MSANDVETLHPDYAKLKKDADFIVSMMDEDAVKMGCRNDKGAVGSNLRKPVSYINAPMEDELYDRYVEHSFLPENIVSDASEEMVGICFKTSATINLPEKIKHLEYHANNKGNGLQSVVESILRDALISRRSAISSDYIGDRSFIEYKKSVSLINWRESALGYVMMVFTESYTDDKGKSQEQRRHYSIESGVLVVTLYRQDQGGKWAEHIELDSNGNAKLPPTLPNNKPYDYIPIRVPQVIKPALLAMAKTVRKGFRLSADYYGLLHKVLPTVVIKSDQDVSKLKVGYESGIQVGQGDAVEILQLSMDGAAPLKTEMTDLFNSAIDQGIRLISSGASRESEEALYLRSSNKQIKIDSIARVVSEEVQEALRVCAILEGANPDEVEFKINVELVEQSIDVDELEEMRKAVFESNLVKWSDYLLKMKAHDLITLDKNTDGSYNTDKYIEEASKEFAILNAEPELA